MGNVIPLAIESMVSLLLVATIGYCWLLNRKLLKLRADETALKATIAELITATDIAERAIGGLKQAVRDCDQQLGERLVRAERLSVELGDQLRSGEDVIRRIGVIVQAARSYRDGAVEAVVHEPEPMIPVAPPPPASRASATMAAAQALVSRARERSGLAA